jgi:hypothetical protein
MSQNSNGRSSVLVKSKRHFPVARNASMDALRPVSITLGGSDVVVVDRGGTPRLEM